MRKLSRSVSVAEDLDEAIRDYAYQARLSLSEVYTRALTSYAPLQAARQPSQAAPSE